MTAEQERIQELETALCDLLGAVKKRSAWDYSDVMDEVLDAEYVLNKRGKRTPSIARQSKERKQVQP